MKDQVSRLNEGRLAFGSGGGPSLFLSLFLSLRLAHAALVSTYFNPDEHWQGPEVAHRAVFGYGYLTWEWEQGIRSFFHPMLFAALYKLLALARLDSPRVLALAPRLLQAVAAAVGDLYTCKLALQVSERPAVATWAAVFQACSWFLSFCIVRPLSNSSEAVLTVVALSHWLRATHGPAPPPPPPPKHETAPVMPPALSAPSASNASRDLRLALFLASVSFVVRPTSAILWAPLAMWRIVTLPSVPARARFVFLNVLPCALPPLLACAVADRWFYGTWVFPPWRFARFSMAGASWYGTHPWHWYATNGLPSMAGTTAPLAVASMLTTLGHRMHPMGRGLCARWRGRYSPLPEEEQGGACDGGRVAPSAGACSARCAGASTRVHAGAGGADASTRACQVGTEPVTVPVPTAATGEPVRKGSCGDGATSARRQCHLGPTPAVPCDSDGRGALTLSLLILWVVAAYSCVSHKEFRFVLPLLPLMHVHAAMAMVALDAALTGGRSSSGPDGSGGDTQDARVGRGKAAGGRPAKGRSVIDAGASGVGDDEAGGGNEGLPVPARWRGRARVALLFVLLAPQVLAGVYFSAVHQRGVTDAMAWVAAEASACRVRSLDMLMPCHATPFYSHTHARVPMRILDCSPPRLPPPCFRPLAPAGMLVGSQGCTSGPAPTFGEVDTLAGVANPSSNLSRECVKWVDPRDGIERWVPPAAACNTGAAPGSGCQLSGAPAGGAPSTGATVATEVSERGAGDALLVVGDHDAGSCAGEGGENDRTQARLGADEADAFMVDPLGFLCARYYDLSADVTPTVGGCVVESSSQCAWHADSSAAVEPFCKGVDKSLLDPMHGDSTWSHGDAVCLPNATHMRMPALCPDPDMHERHSSRYWGPRDRLLPSHFMMFSSLLPQLEVFLVANDYHPVARFFHAHFAVDRGLQAEVIVFTRGQCELSKI
eukprot:jgi/Mesvir1/17431/Mv08709-RA.1